MSALTKNSVFVVIPVHNRSTITLNCLATLSQYNILGHYQVTVVDDGSTDGTAAAIRKAYPSVRILEGDGNLWWTGAIALGMDYAFEQGASYCIWLNDDCLPEPGTLDCLVEFAQEHPNSLVSAACYTAETRVLLESGFQGRTPVTARPHEVVAVDGLSGYCVLVPIAVWQSIGAPDSHRFPHYAGDTMYTLKATRAGFKAYIVGKAIAHLVGPLNPTPSFSETLKIQSDFASIFGKRKSVYYLPTQYFYHIEKYHFFPGLLIFSAKLLSWIGQWLQHQIRRL